MVYSTHCATHSTYCQAKNYTKPTRSANRVRASCEFVGRHGQSQIWEYGYETNKTKQGGCLLFGRFSAIQRRRGRCLVALHVVTVPSQVAAKPVFNVTGDSELVRFAGIDH